MFKNLTFIVAAIALAFNSHGAEISGGGVNLSSPSAIGNVTPNTGAFTTVTTPTLNATGTAKLTLNASEASAGQTSWEFKNLTTTGPRLTIVGSDRNFSLSANSSATGGAVIGNWQIQRENSELSFVSGNGSITYGVIVGEAANTLALRNGTTAQTLNVYGTYTNSTNYRLGKASTSTGGVLTISAEGLGTGATGNTISLATNGTERINIGSGGVVSIINTLSVGSGGTAIAKVLSAVATLDYTSIAAGLEQTQTITVTGATTTNTPSVSIGWGSAGLEANLTVTKAWVSAADTVSVTLRNMNTITAIDPASISARATVTQF